jgi:macrolide transport system ATP-binding/permease protein
MSTAASQLRAVALTRSYSDRLVVDLAELVVGAGERLGLVGENGAGTSTLLRLLAGAEEPDTGTVVVHGSVGHLAQTVQLPFTASVQDMLDGALRDLHALRDRIQALAEQMGHDPSPRVLDEYAERLAEFEAREGWSASARVDATLAGLGLAELDRSRTLGTLSGGQRSRLALAGLLVRRPEVLLLDEPTNHLDDDALGYLESTLASWPGVVVAASHDRAFLDGVCTAIVDLDPGRDGATRYGGSYTAYLDARAAEHERWQRAYGDWQDETNRLQRLADGSTHRIAPNRGPTDNDKHITKFKGQRVAAAVSQRARDAEQRLARLRAEPVPKPPRSLRFVPRQAADVSDGVLVALREVVVPGRLRLDVLDVAHDTRLLVTGPNGAGKSTLLAVIAGDLPPAAGRVMVRRGVRVGLLAQELRWTHPERSAAATFAAGRPGSPEEHVSALLDLGLLHPRELRTPVGRLSVGQQRRLALARLLACDPDVLLLDEPTDHLSPALADELEQAVRERKGPVIVVSHDRWLRRNWDGTEIHLDAGRLLP